MFSDADREIFSFTAGGVDRRADPLAVDMRLVDALGGQDQIDRIQADLAPDEPGLPPKGLDAVLGAVRRVLPAICEAFRVTLFEDDPAAGVTVAEAIGIFTDYIEFKADLEKKRGSSPATSPPTAIPPAGPSPTPSFAGLGGTGR